jgi:hypothetical protein
VAITRGDRSCDPSELVYPGNLADGKPRRMSEHSKPTSRMSVLQARMRTRNSTTITQGAPPKYSRDNLRHPLLAAGIDIAC